MTTRHNLTQKANRLRKEFVALNAKVSALGTQPQNLTPGQQRSLFIAFRNLRRTYDDLRKVEAQLRKMP